MSGRNGTGNSRQSSAGAPMAGSKVQNVKLVLLGDQGVGKSSIALRFVRGEFTENSEATIGGTYCSVICYLHFPLHFQMYLRRYVTPAVLMCI